MRGRHSKAVPESPGYLARYRERAARNSEGFGGREQSLYLRRFRAPMRHFEGARRLPEREAVEAHLIRHGQTQGYTVDGGLTPLGALQARRRGWEISREIQERESVALVAARTSRAFRTAEFILGGVEDGMAALEKGASVAGPEYADELQNFLVRTPSGLKDPTVAARGRQTEIQRPGQNGGSGPLWIEEVGRFWERQQAGLDPIEYWLTFPLLTFEPPASVVRRYWAGLVRLAREGSVDRLVCAVHSGPMRAFAATAIGRDLGEPANTEEVRVRLERDLSEAEVFYRGHSRRIEIPPFDGHAGWSEPTHEEEARTRSYAENGSRDGGREVMAENPAKQMGKE